MVVVIERRRRKGAAAYVLGKSGYRTRPPDVLSFRLVDLLLAFNNIHPLEQGHHRLSSLAHGPKRTPLIITLVCPVPGYARRPWGGRWARHIVNGVLKPSRLSYHLGRSLLLWDRGRRYFWGHCAWIQDLIG